MNTGRFLAVATLVAALAAGAGVYYTQVYAFYDEVQAEGTDAVQLTVMASGQPEPILYEDFEAIDRDSSPLAYRACFTTPMSFAMLTETYEPYVGAEPRNAPRWFSCFDAAALGAELEAGRALLFTGQRNLEWGVDRVVAITDDGRGYVWHELNDCGDKAYDGTPLGDDCPPRPDPAPRQPD